MNSILFKTLLELVVQLVVELVKQFAAACRLWVLGPQLGVGPDEDDGAEFFGLLGGCDGRGMADRRAPKGGCHSTDLTA